MTGAFQALWWATALAFAQTEPQPGPGDPRIQVATYSPDQVVSLRVALGFAVVVELASDERVENVVVGNSAGWQVTPNGRGDRVVVKPLGAAAVTNMVVLTGTRRYVFLLEPSDGGGLAPFVLRFAYPEAVDDASAALPIIATYRLRGSRSLYPISMTDDGQRTSIAFTPGTDVPAIFLINERGREALVNGRMVEDRFVVEGVADRFVLRLGKARATASRQPIVLTR